MKEILKRKEGITLVALIVMIIIIIIIAGISIALLAGKNGIITQVRDARRQTRIAKIIEKAKIDVVAQQSKNNNKIKITERQLDDILKKYDKDGEVRTNKQGEKYIITEKKDEIKAIEIYNGEFILDSK